MCIHMMDEGDVSHLSRWGQGGLDGGNRVYREGVSRRGVVRTCCHGAGNRKCKASKYNLTVSEDQRATSTF